MRHFSSSLSLRARLIILAFLSVVPALALLFYTGYERKSDDEAEIRAHTLQLAKSASRHIEQLAEGSRQVLMVLSEMKTIVSDDSVDCSTSLSNFKRNLPMYRNFFAVKPNGDVFCSALPWDGSLNVAGRKWFQRTVQERSYTFGEYHIGRISNDPTVCAALPIIGKGGQISGVVATGFNLNWINEQLSRIKIPKEASFLVIDREGTVLSRYPNPERWVGRNVSNTSIVTTILRDKEGTVEAVGLEGSKRIFSFVPVEGTGEGIYIALGISREVAYSGVHRMILRSIILWAITTLIAGVAVWFGGDIFIMNRVRKLMKATDELSKGNLSARVDSSDGRDEISQLGRSFNQMALALEQFILEQKNAEARLKRAHGELERRVEERTIELSNLNTQLKEEIEIRRRAEEELTELTNELKSSNAHLKNFTHVISHDLKSPLTTIGGFANLLLRRYDGKLDAEARGILGDIVNGVNRMQDLIKDLIEYSQAGTKKIQLKSVDCASIVEKAMSNLNGEIATYRAVVTYADLPLIMADSPQLTRVFQNLIANAIKYRREEAPRIHIAATQGDKEWIFSVQDNGIGIDPRGSERIFGMFQRLSTEQPGSGIGLATCKEIVERHGGRIWVESNPGKGSSFHFTISSEKGSEKAKLLV